MTKLLDIVFQSGEFINPDNSWVTDLLVTIVGAAIGAGVGAFWRAGVAISCVVSFCEKNVCRVVNKRYGSIVRRGPRSNVDFATVHISQTHAP